MMKKVIVSGAAGRMGQEVVRTVVEDTDDNLVGAFDKKNVGQDIVAELGLNEPECFIEDNLENLIQNTEPDVIIDFSSPKGVMENIKTGLSHNVNMIIGTTGITEVDKKYIEKLAIENNVNILIAPNFALGAVLLMKYSADAAKYMDDVEIIELHHDQKIDSPSGTAIKTAELINENKVNNSGEGNSKDRIEKIQGARGGTKEGIHIHSIRLPGLVAHQEVIFGGEGQSLTIRHDSFNRKSFMPGVRMALDKILGINGLVYGLENILE